MNIKKFMNTDLIYLNQEFETSEEMIRFAANILHEKGYVTDQYTNGVLERERKYPTGLSIGSINCAIPHSEMEYVLKPAILILTLKNPVNFKNMENTVEDIPVKTIFMLAINDGQQHLTVLQDLMKILRNEELIETLLDTKDKNDVLGILDEHLKEI